MLEYAINASTIYKLEQLQIGMTVGIGTLDPWNNQKLVLGTVSSVVTSDSGVVLKVALKNEVQMNVQEIEAVDIEHIVGATLRQTNPPQHPKKVPNELHYIDAYLTETLIKVGNPYREGGEIVTAITLEGNGMAVVHGESGIIVVIKSEYLELYYV